MKHRVSMTVDKENYQYLTSSGVNVSGLINEVLKQEARRIRAEEWKKENSKGLEEVAQFVASHGSFADENRSW